MTDSNYTAIAVLVDRSGSMYSIRDDAEGALNSFIKEQKKVEGKATIRLSEFDDKYEVVYKSTPLDYVEDYTLIPRHNTALNDSWAKLINDFGAELKALPENRRPGKVLFVVVTDGLENASKEYTTEMVKALVEKQTREYDWDFVFLAANQDAITTGAGYGVQRGSTMTFNPTRIGVTNTGMSLNNYAASYRSTGSAAFTEEDRLAAVDSNV